MSERIDVLAVMDAEIRALPEMASLAGASGVSCDATEAVRRMEDARAAVAELIERDQKAQEVYTCILRALNDADNDTRLLRFAHGWIESWARALHKAGFQPTTPEAADIRAALAAQPLGARELPELPDSFARVCADGYWLSRKAGTEKFDVVDSRNRWPAQEVYSADQMRAYGEQCATARAHAAQGCPEGGATLEREVMGWLDSVDDANSRNVAKRHIRKLLRDAFPAAPSAGQEGE